MIRVVADIMRATSAVFLREMVRSARRWQTYGLRVVFGVGLFGLVLFLWADSMGEWGDVARASEVGRALFITYAGAQMLIAAMTAPSLVAQGIIEEKEDETLDLLAITRLGPRQIVGGKVASRLWTLVMVVLGGTPVLALVVSFGGVSPWQLVNTVANTLLILVLLGSVAGLFALLGRSMLLPLAATTLWAVPALGILPGVYVLAADAREEHFTHLMPPLAMVADGPQGLLPVLAFLPVIWLLWRWSGPLFALNALFADDHEGSLLSVDFWRFEVFRRRMGMVGAAVVLLAPVMAWISWYLNASRPLATGGALAARATLWAFAVLLLFAGTGLYVLVVIELRNLVQRFRERSLRRREAQAEVARERAEDGRPGRRWTRRVWSNPVAWREIVTGAWGSTWLARWGMVLWLIAVSLLATVAGPRETTSAFALTGTLACLAFTSTLGTESLVSERRAETLELLLNTTMGSARVVAGKLAALAVWSLPYLVIGWGVLALYTLQDTSSTGHGGGPWCEYSTLAMGHAGLGMPLTAAWLLGAWASFALTCLLVAGRARPANLAWGVNSVILMGMVLLPFLLDEWLGWRDLRVFLMPFTDDGWLVSGCGISPHLVAAAVLAPTAAAGLFALAVWRLRRSPWRG